MGPPRLIGYAGLAPRRSRALGAGALARARGRAAEIAHRVEAARCLDPAGERAVEVLAEEPADRPAARRRRGAHRALFGIPARREAGDVLARAIVGERDAD